MPTEQSFDDAFAELTEQAPVDENTPTAEPANLDAEALATPPEGAEPAPTAEPEQALPAAGTPPSLEDMLAFVPKAQQDTFKELIEKQRRSLASEQGRQSALQRHYAEARATADAEAQRAAALAEQLRDLQALAAKPQTPATQAQLNEELDDLEKEFPEISKSINLRIERMLKGVVPQPPAQQPAAAPAQEQPQQITPASPDMTVLAQQYTALAAVHPDWQQTVATPEHKAWFDLQPPGIQAMYGSDDARDAIKALNLFKAEMAGAKNRVAETRQTENRKRLEQHVGVRSTPSRATGVPDDFEGAFNFFASQAG